MIQHVNQHENIKFFNNTYNLLQEITILIVKVKYIIQYQEKNVFVVLMKRGNFIFNNEQSYINEMKKKSSEDNVSDGSKSGYSSVTKSDYKDMEERIGNIKKSFDDKNYNYKQSKEFTIEMNRTANLVLNSNLVPLSTGVKNAIRDLTVWIKIIR